MMRIGKEVVRATIDAIVVDVVVVYEIIVSTKVNILVAGLRTRLSNVL